MPGYFNNRAGELLVTMAGKVNDQSSITLQKLQQTPANIVIQHIPNEVICGSSDSIQPHAKRLLFAIIKPVKLLPVITAHPNTTRVENKVITGEDPPQESAKKDKQRNIGNDLLLSGIVCFIIGALLAFLSGAPLYFILLLFAADILLITGLILILTAGPGSKNPSGESVGASGTDYARPKSQTGDDYDTNVGLLGLLLMIGANLPGIIYVLAALSLAVGGYSAGVFGMLVFSGLLAAAITVSGLIFCIRATEHKDKHRALGQAGIILFLISLFLSLIPLTIALTQNL